MVSASLGIKTDLIRKTTVVINERFPHSSIQPLGFDGALIETLMPRFLPGALRRAVAKRAYGFFLQTEDGSDVGNRVQPGTPPVLDYDEARLPGAALEHRRFTRDRKSTRLNSSHGYISYAVFCLKKKKKTNIRLTYTRTHISQRLTNKRLHVDPV